MRTLIDSSFYEQLRDIQDIKFYIEKTDQAFELTENESTDQFTRHAIDILGNHYFHASRGTFSNYDQGDIEPSNVYRIYPKALESVIKAIDLINSEAFQSIAILPSLVARLTQDNYALFASELIVNKDGFCFKDYYDFNDILEQIYSQPFTVEIFKSLPVTLDNLYPLFHGASLFNDNEKYDIEYYSASKYDAEQQAHYEKTLLTALTDEEDSLRRSL